MSDRLFIFDTTLRDGEQVPGCQLNTVEKIQVIDTLYIKEMKVLPEDEGLTEELVEREGY